MGLDERGRSRRSERHLVATVLALWLLLGVLAGCGSSKSSTDGVASVDGSGKPAASSSEAPALDSEDRALQFANCLRGHGLDVQDPGPGGRPKLGNNTDPAKVQAALNACRQYAPDVMASGSLTPEEREQMLAYVKCLREHGIAISDPDPDTGMPQQRDFVKFRQPDAAMKQAQQACVDKQPNFLNLGGGH
jgi:hypothetical protein